MAKPKPRKWDNQKGKLPAPPVPADMSDWFKEVLRVKDLYKGKSMDELAVLWNKLDAAEDRATKQAKARTVIYEALELLVLEHLETVKAVSGGDIWRGEGRTFSPKNTIVPIVRDKVALRQWIKSTGQDDLLSLAAPTLKAVVVALLERAEELTPAERAKLKGDPGEPGTAPPGVVIYLKPGVNTSSR